MQLEHYFVDGTKIEANANRYTFVLGKAVVKHKAKLREKVQTLFAAIEEAEKQEESAHGGQDLLEMGNPLPSLVKSLSKLSSNWKIACRRNRKTNRSKRRAYPPQRLASTTPEVRDAWRDFRQAKQLQQTDHDATFMRMKEDHMRNGQLKPGYNVQIGTENQFIVGYSVHQSKEKTESWYEIEYRHYRSAGCEDCPLKPQCTKAQVNREIKVSMKYLRLKNQAGQKLRSEEGYALAVRRMIEPEPVFGDMKNNWDFKRFLLRGLPKASFEVGWLSLAHNLLKKAAADAKNQGAKRSVLA
ncbi:transposase [Paenibacillus phoenicis]|uniref:transposase n=1 Tax=Paenibacillus phoenicis TaxID=554117 RepID=UPI003899377D